MAQPVWVLSVDLQAKTATFQTGLAEAARSARGSFTDIKTGSGEMGREVGGNMMEARHGVMLLGEEFGVHLPRALSTFLASIGPIGAAMEAAFPFLAIIALAGILVEHLKKIKEAGEKLTEDQTKFATAAQNAFNQLDQKLLEAGIKIDELRGDHLGALHEKLKLIDMQSMEELVHSFGEVAKAADTVFKDLETHWYNFDAGSAGAKHSLETFQTQYESLLAQGKGTEAAAFLDKKVAREKEVLELQKQAQAYSPTNDTKGNDAKYTAGVAARAKLKEMEAAWDQKSIQAQQILVQTLQDQVVMEGKISELKKKDTNAAVTGTQKTMNEEAAQRDAARIAAAQKMAEETTRVLQDAYKKQLEVIQGGERESIAATRQGSQARLDAIDQALAEEKKVMGDDTAFYRDLLVQRVQVTREMSLQEGAQARAAQVEQASSDEKMRTLQLASLQGFLALYNSAHRLSEAQRVAEGEAMSELEYQNKLQAAQREIESLDTTSADYLNKLKEAQDKEKELTQQHENEITAIREKAEEERNQRVLSAEERFQSTIASGLTKALMGQESWAKMFSQLGNQVVSGLMENAIKSVLADDYTKERDAAAAARMGFMSGMKLPFPANIVAAPVMAAAAFTSVMAFSQGGIVPGYGSGDTVPAMLTPGEPVLPKNMADRLNRAMDDKPQGNQIHVHGVHFAPEVHALDADGVDDVLTKHGAVFQKHFERTMRRIHG